VLAALVAAAGLLGCSTEEEPLPAACLAGREAVAEALEAAPGPVAVEGTPLSGCMTRSSEPSDIQTVGGIYLGVAQELAEEAGREPEGEAAMRLGYLVGAARRGAARTQGIHDELVRRLEQEMVLVDPDSSSLRDGQRAGRTLG
jgi:hypothetical protein